MRAAVAHRFGPPEVLAVDSVPDPVPRAGQVLVEVQYAGITFVETQIRAGRPPDPAMSPSLPLIPGNGVGGVVTDVGPGADRDLIGRRVVTTTGGSGGYAELAAVDAQQLLPVPDAVPIPDAVALLADGRTALALMGLAAVAPGETVLVEAAAGGVGTCLVQLARGAGARVIACAGSADKLAAIAGLGADVHVDYSVAGWAARLRAEGELADVVFDGVGGAIGLDAAGLVRPGGRLCQYGMASGGFTELPPGFGDRDISVFRGVRLDAAGSRELSARALERAAAGQLRPMIGQTFPLERAAEAHAAMEARTTVGKTLLRVPPRSHP
jgi:NADPH:quinone reductase